MKTLHHCPEGIQHCGMKQPSRRNNQSSGHHLAGIMTAPMPAQWASHGVAMVVGMEAVHCSSPSTCPQPWTSHPLTGVTETHPQWTAWNCISISEAVSWVTWTNTMLFCPVFLHLSLLPPSLLSFLCSFLRVCRTASLDQEEWSRSYWEIFHLCPAMSIYWSVILC